MPTAVVTSYPTPDSGTQAVTTSIPPVGPVQLPGPTPDLPPGTTGNDPADPLGADQLLDRIEALADRLNGVLRAIQTSARELADLERQRQVLLAGMNAATDPVIKQTLTDALRDNEKAIRDEQRLLDAAMQLYNLPLNQYNSLVIQYLHIPGSHTTNLPGVYGPETPVNFLPPGPIQDRYFPPLREGEFDQVPAIWA